MHGLKICQNRGRAWQKRSGNTVVLKLLDFELRYSCRLSGQKGFCPNVSMGSWLAAKLLRYKKKGHLRFANLKSSLKKGI